MSFFVPRFSLPKYNVLLSEFKGHHRKALAHIERLAPQLDLVIEVRDGRAPVSTRNVLVDRALSKKQKLVLYSKRDLCKLDIDMFTRWHDQSGDKFMFIDPRAKRDTTLLIRYLQQIYYEMDPPPPLGLRCMITGMPNVGKSTLVNSLRAVGLHSASKVAKTGFQPGVTRTTSEIIRVSQDPPILVYDTPGIMIPRAEDAKTMLALSVIHSINSNAIDPVVQCDFLLYMMNLQDPRAYRRYCEPTNNIEQLLQAVSQQPLTPSIEKSVAIGFITRFNNGDFGRHFLDIECVYNRDSFRFSEFDARSAAQFEGKVERKRTAKKIKADMIAHKANKVFKAAQN